MEREIYHPPYSGQQREIWRPGDGDGEIGTDYFERQGEPLPLGQRWRLFQSDIGPVKPRKNEPPKNVLLDDRAAWDLTISEIPRAHLGAHWPHDFNSSGTIRSRRPHRGRAAVKDADGIGNEMYHSVTVGKATAPYYFTGEKGYTPVVYEIPPRVASERKGPPPEVPGARKLKHNQYTPKDQMVKNGAPSFAKAPKSQRPRINRFLLKGPSPPVPYPAMMRALQRQNPASTKVTGNHTSLEGARLTSRNRVSYTGEETQSSQDRTRPDENAVGARDANEREGAYSKRLKSGHRPYSTPTDTTRNEEMEKMKARLREAKVAHILQENERHDLEAALKQSRMEADRLQMALKQSRIESEHWKGMLNRQRDRRGV